MRKCTVFEHPVVNSTESHLICTQCKNYFATGTQLWIIEFGSIQNIWYAQILSCPSAEDFIEDLLNSFGDIASFLRGTTLCQTAFFFSFSFLKIKKYKYKGAACFKEMAQKELWRYFIMYRMEAASFR